MRQGPKILYSFHKRGLDNNLEVTGSRPVSGRLLFVSLFDVKSLPLSIYSYVLYFLVYQMPSTIRNLFPAANLNRSPETFQTKFCVTTTCF